MAKRKIKELASLVLQMLVCAEGKQDGKEVRRGTRQMGERC
jgi:hypothetical protein